VSTLVAGISLGRCILEETFVSYIDCAMWDPSYHALENTPKT